MGKEILLKLRGFRQPVTHPLCSKRLRSKGALRLNRGVHIQGRPDQPMATALRAAGGVTQAGLKNRAVVDLP